MGTKPGDIYTAQIMTIKIKKGIPTQGGEEEC